MRHTFPRCQLFLGAVYLLQYFKTLLHPLERLYVQQYGHTTTMLCKHHGPLRLLDLLHEGRDPCPKFGQRTDIFVDLESGNADLGVL